MARAWHDLDRLHSTSNDAFVAFVYTVKLRLYKFVTYVKVISCIN